MATHKVGDRNRTDRTGGRRERPEPESSVPPDRTEQPARLPHEAERRKVR